eukprot:g7288.t1
MCGVLAALGLTSDADTNRKAVLKASTLQRHRGPDASGVYQSPDGTVVMSHERLSIIDPSDAGIQPMKIHKPHGDLVWIVNSEIYNHEKLRETELAEMDLSWTSCDSAVVGYLYEKFGPSEKVLSSLNGIFCGVVYDESTGEFFAFRDPIGINSLYWGQDKFGAYWFASEMKSIHDQCESFDIFPPGFMYHSKTKELVRFFNPKWIDQSIVPSQKVDYGRVKDLVIDAVIKRLMTDVPFAMYLSGGLDSSLVASIATRHLKEARNTFDKKSRLHTFSIGIKGSPDLKAARKVAEFLGTVHHECHMNVQQGLDSLRDLVYHLESYHQVRAALPNYLLARRVKAAGFKVVLSGEGADEALGGYLYFHKAPNKAEFHKETIRKTMRLHYWDVLRANKASYTWGVEVRVPFLDLDFLDYIMSIDPIDKMCDLTQKPDGVHPKMEKWILRKAFDDKENPYLPESVLFRQKEQFSDGVGYEWVDGLRDYANKAVTDKMWGKRAEDFPYDVPLTKEYYYLQSLFNELYPNSSSTKTVPKGLSVACSTPEAVEWDPTWKNLHEISGRAIDVHSAADQFVFDEIENGITIADNGHSK